jgi:hypothetical protein
VAWHDGHRYRDIFLTVSTRLKVISHRNLRSTMSARNSCIYDARMLPFIAGVQILDIDLVQTSHCGYQVSLVALYLIRG